jgi:CRP-like cAMP-binding protein
MVLTATLDDERGVDRQAIEDPSPVLSAVQLALLRSLGRLRSVRAGEVLFEAGETERDFYVVIEGQVAVVYEQGDAEHTLVTHARGESSATCRS